VPRRNPAGRWLFPTEVAGFEFSVVLLRAFARVEQFRVAALSEQF
jgi:hypothetical protein